MFSTKAMLVTISRDHSSKGVMSLFDLSSNAGPAPVATVRPGKLMTLTARPHVPGDILNVCRSLAAQAGDHSATPVHMLVFGNCRASATVHDALRRAFGRLDWPVTFVEGGQCGVLPIAGIQAHFFTGNVDRVMHDGKIVGSVFTDGGARQCVLGGLTSVDASALRSRQTLQALENLEAILSGAGFELADTVRTWFYLENILSWYDEFNQARTSVYSGLKFRTGSLPASTGVGAGNPAGTALTLAAWAFRPVERNSYAEEVASPLQCPAPAYGSSFSRAMETSTNNGRRLFISGTASIAPGGKTVWVGDLRKQVELTMNVVEAILHSRGFAFKDFSRATAYFRRPTDAPAFSDWLAAKRLVNMPVVSAQCDVCRDDLLFELEAEAETQVKR
jgi:enamine deaminase RidA (YjgF/YER057c/UK114 family)